MFAQPVQDHGDCRRRLLLLMGPDKLPEVAHRLGSSWRALKRLQERVETEVRDAIPDLPSTGDIARIVRSPSIC